MSIPTQAEYEHRERQEFRRQLRQAESGTLAERREACQDFLDVMKIDPVLVAERIDWLLAGNYGYGAMQAAKAVLLRPRMNKKAWLTHVIGAIEWQCPQRACAAAWKKLTPAEKKALDQAIDAELQRHARREAEG